MTQRWSNNASTTLSASVASGDTTISVADSGAFAVLEVGDFEVVTIDSGAALEIVKVTARSGNAWTVVRAQEGTAAAEWSAGATVEARITAGSLDNLGGGETLGRDLTSLDHGGNARGADAVNLQPGRNAATQVASGEHSIAIGFSSEASTSSAIAIGRDAKAGGAYGFSYHGVAVGVSAQSSGAASTALGSYARAIGAISAGIGGDSRAYGGRSFTFNGAPHSGLSVEFAGFHIIPDEDWHDQAEHKMAGTRATIATPYVNLAVPADWTAATTYRHGDVVRPTGGGTAQYRAWCDWDSVTYLHRTPVSGASEPTWPGAGGYAEIDVDASGYWIGTDWSDGYLTVAIPEWLTFTPTEVAFLCQDYSALTGSMTISVGTAAEPTRVLNAAEITITGVNQIYRCAMPNPSSGFAAGEQILIRVDSFASAGKCVGRFLVSGYFVETKSRA